MRSRAWYVAALIPALVGVAIAIPLIRSVGDEIERMPRVVIPGSKTMNLAAGDYYILGESESRVDGTVYENDDFTFECPCTLVDAADRPVALDPAQFHQMKYGMRGFRGKAMFEVTIPTDGRYTLSCDGDGTGRAVAAIGHGIRVRGALATVSIVGGPVATIALLIFVYLRRRKRADA